MGKVDNASGLKPTLSFEHLVIGPSNQVAAGACQAVAKDPGNTYNPLFLYGPSGVGKTHLMQAAANQMVKDKPGAKVRYISAERFMSEIVAAVSEDRVTEVRQKFSDLDLLIIDDIQYLVESKVSQEELFHVFNNMYDDNRQVIIAADRPPSQLTDLDKNICSRLEWGLAADIKVPDLNTRVEILKKKQAVQGLELNGDMLAYAAEHLRSNVRELEGFLKRVHAYTTLSHQELSMSLVQTVVHEILPQGMAPPSVEAPVAKPPSPLPAVPPPVINAPPQNGTANGNGSQPMENGSSSKNPAEPPPEKEAVVPVAAAAPEAAVAPASGSLEALLQSMSKSSGEKAAAAEAANKGLPAAADSAVEAPAPESADDYELPSGYKEIGAVFFYPENSLEALETVHRKFQEVIKKHKLKFRLKKVHAEPYTFKGKINYTSFVDVCKSNRVPVAIVIGPPPETFIPEQDFYDLLTVTLDVQGVSLQLVNWGEINKDYRYLNLALDIALVRSR